MYCIPLCPSARTPPGPISGLVLLRPAPLSSVFFNLQVQAGDSQSGVRPWAPLLRGHGARNVGCWAGPGRDGSGGCAPGPDWNKVAALGAQPGFTDLAWCSSHRVGPAPGRLPVFPGVGTPWGNGLSCGCGVGMPPSTWGRPGRRGHAGSVGAFRRLGTPQPANVRLPETGSRTPDSETLQEWWNLCHRNSHLLSVHCVPTVLSTLYGLTPCILGSMIPPTYRWGD